MKLNEILNMTSGPNSSRIKDGYKNIPRYFVTDLEDDLLQVPNESHPLESELKEPIFTREGDLLISIIKEKAAVVGKGREGFILTSGFIRCEYDKNILDPWFFCYFFNQSNAVDMEIHFRSGMPGLGSYHLNAKTIGEIEIDLPTLEKQKKLGRLYKDCLNQMRLYDKKKNTLMKGINLIINEELN